MTIANLEERDFPVIREWIDPNLFRGFRAPIGDDQLQRLLTRRTEGRITDLGLKAADDSGSVSAFIHVVFDWSNELGHIQQILVGPAWRRRGIGRALMQQALRICFAEHGLHRMQLFVDEDNGPAIAFYRQEGFATDGVMREALKRGDRFVNWCCMSMLRSEWRARNTGNQPLQ